MNGAPPAKAEAEGDEPSQPEADNTASPDVSTETAEVTKEEDSALADTEAVNASTEEETSEAVTEQLQELNLNEPASEDAEDAAEDGEEAEEDDGDGEWISRSPFPLSLIQHSLTFELAPSNIKKYQQREGAGGAPKPVQRILQAALITADMAMRNVALRINLK